MLTLDEALAFIPSRELGESDTRLAANGNELHGLPAGRFRVYGGGRLLGVYEGAGDGSRPLRDLPGGGVTMRIYRALTRFPIPRAPAGWWPSACSTACIAGISRSCARRSRPRGPRGPRRPR